MNHSDSANRLAGVQADMAAAARRAGREPGDIRLIAVSKRHPAEAVRRLMEAGQQDFAENQVQEGLEKIADVGRPAPCWHFIGHLQSNKTRHVPGQFEWVHTIDSERLFKRLETAALANRAQLRALLQVNVAADPAKHGVMPADLLPLVERILELDCRAVSLRGLMTIGYRDADEHRSRATFAALRELLEQCRERFGPQFTELSMGMSGDYALAIEEGATMVRVGTALFGPRADDRDA